MVLKKTNVIAFAIIFIMATSSANAMESSASSQEEEINYPLIIQNGRTSALKFVLKEKDVKEAAQEKLSQEKIAALKAAQQPTGEFQPVQSVSEKKSWLAEVIGQRNADQMRQPTRETANQKKHGDPIDGGQ